MAYEYKPIPPAIKFHEYQAKINLLVAGARGGKTRTALGGQLISDIYLQPGYYQKDIDDREPYRIGVCEPTASMMLSIAYFPLLKRLDQSRIIDNKQKPITCIFFKGIWGTTEIDFFSYEQGEGAIEGLPYYRFYLDECFQMNEKFFIETGVRCSDRAGKRILSGTPKYNKKYITDLIYQKRSGFLSDKEFLYWTWFTAKNPYFPKEELDFYKKIMPLKLYKRNYEASLDVFEGQIYDEYDENKHHVDFSVDLSRYIVVVAGQDWGYTHNGVLTIIGITADRSVDILEVVARKGIPVNPPYPEYTGETWVSIAKSKKKEYNIEAIYAGPDEPEHINAYMLNDIFCHAADNSVHAGIQWVMTLMHIDDNGHTRYRIRRGYCDLLSQEKKMYRWKPLSDGRETEEPLKENDDACDSERYGLFSAKDYFHM